MKKLFYVFRHGQTDLNAAGVWQGVKLNPPLNQIGEEQAASLGKKLLPLGIQAIYSSHLVRAKQTSLIVSEFVRVPMYVTTDLQECNFGDAEGMKMTEVEKRNPELMYNILHPRPETWHLKFSGKDSESKQEVFARVSKRLREIAKNCQETTIGISTHGGVMSSLLSGLEAYDVELPNCCVAKIKYDEATDSLSFVGMI